MDKDQNQLGVVATQDQLALISALSFGGVFLIICSGWLSNMVGRKPLFICACLCYLICWTIILFTTNMSLVYLAKFIGSNGAGLSYTNSVLYLSEISSVKIRGMALTATGMFTNIGILVVYSIGPFVSYKTLNLFAVISTFCWLVIMTMIPESPAYLLSKGKPDKAERVLQYLGKTKQDESEQIQSVLNSSRSFNRFIFKFKQIFTVQKNLKAFTICTSILILQALSGFNVIVIYINSIFENSGSSVPPHIAAIIVGIFQLLPSMITSLLVEKVGRKALILLSCFVTCLCNLLLGTVFYLEHVGSPAVKHITWLPLVCLVAFIFFYWIGLGVIPMTIAGELLDVSVKSLACSITLFIEVLAIIAVVYAYGYFKTVVAEHISFWSFALFCAMNFGLILKFLPETKGKTFGEIQRDL